MAPIRFRIESLADFDDIGILEVMRGIRHVDDVT